MSGLFIVVESQDGGGKGTMTPRIVEYLQLRFGNDKVVQTKEPGGTSLGEAIREILFNSIGIKNMSIGVVDCLFLASHLQNLHNVVAPALAAGKIVVSDRYFYSQSAYATQRMVPPSIAAAYEECHGPNADLMLFLHGSSQTLLTRANSRISESHQSAKPWNDVGVQDRVRQAYIDLFSHLPEYHPICVDGKGIEEVWLEVKQAVDKLLEYKEVAA